MKALIIDDEVLTRQKVHQLSRDFEGLEIIGECKDGLEGIEMIHQKKPDLVFLDIQMPELDGFNMIQLLEEEPIPQIIFITAYSHFAHKAFEINAVDYLLKPIKKERFNEAVQRCKERILRNDAHTRAKDLKSLFKKLTNSQSIRIAVKSENEINILKPEEVIWIKAEGNYVRLFTQSKFYLKRISMQKMLELLPDDSFIRIHKSHLINLDYLEKIEPHFHGDYVVTLKGGIKLNCSRHYADHLLSALK